MKKLNFLMCFHCHQPVDNFERIFKEAYEKSYEPFLSVLERHPKVKLSLHYSGSLLDWLAEKKPLFLERVKNLAKKGQVEILTGGYFEPILPMIPTEDAKGQIEMLTEAVRKFFDFEPRGIWLAERVWDPAALYAIFKELNITYTIIDDFHLTKTGRGNEEMFGHYRVKNFENLSVFPSLRKLRYAMPFIEPAATLNFLKNLCGKERVRSVTFADDCEKFGLWPRTYDWVYRKGWLTKFFKAIEERDWIKTLTFQEALEESDSLGEASIPPSSYSEMFEWSSGNFRNFFRKYPESELMRRRMLYVSGKIKDLQEREVPESTQKIETAKIELYKSQSNCAYWHGIFGGIYSSYLRQGIYRHIIKAENILNGGREDSEASTLCLGDNDNRIIHLRNKYISLFVDPGYAGSIFEMDYSPLTYNLTGTMSRRYEPYHEKINKSRKVSEKSMEDTIGRDESIDLYEVLGVREAGLRKFLNYDSYRKFSFFCHVMNTETSLEDFVKSDHIDSDKNSLFGPYTCEIESENEKLTAHLARESSVSSAFSRGEARNAGEKQRSLKLDKHIILGKEPEILMKLELKNAGSESLEFLFGLEFNWFIQDRVFMKMKRLNLARKIILADRFTGLKVEHLFETPVNVWSFPIYTLNESERGIGKDFQGVSLLFSRRLFLKENEKFSLDASLRILG